MWRSAARVAREREDVAALKMTTRGATPGQQPRRILVIDDDPIVAESLGEFLRSEGHEAATALDALEGLTALKAAEENSPETGRAARPFDVVLCDINLPGMNGLELLREIRRKHRGSATIMLTGYGTIESAIESLRLGASDYLVKPVVDAELRMSLQRALAQLRGELT